VSLVFYGESSVHDHGNESGGGRGYGYGCGAGDDFWGNATACIYGERDEQNGGEVTNEEVSGAKIYYGCGTLENCGSDRGGGQGQLLGSVAPSFVAV